MADQRPKQTPVIGLVNVCFGAEFQSSLTVSVRSKPDYYILGVLVTEFANRDVVRGPFAAFG